MRVHFVVFASCAPCAVCRAPCALHCLRLAFAFTLDLKMQWLHATVATSVLVRRMGRDKQPRRRTCLWQRADWPQWRWDAIALAVPVAQMHRAQGHLACRMVERGGWRSTTRQT